MRGNKAALDREISKHADERIQFSLYSDQLGVVDLDVPIGDLFDNLTLVFLDDAIKANMKLGKMYEYAASPFKGEPSTDAMFLFAGCVDPDKDEMFVFDKVDDCPIMCYAFPADKLREWVVPKEKVVKSAVKSYKADTIDIEELTDLLEEGIDPDDLDQWLIDHGAEPI